MEKLITIRIEASSEEGFNHQLNKVINQVKNGHKVGAYSHEDEAYYFTVEEQK